MYAVAHPSDYSPRLELNETDILANYVAVVKTFNIRLFEYRLLNYISQYFQRKLVKSINEAAASLEVRLSEIDSMSVDQCKQSLKSFLEYRFEERIEGYHGRLKQENYFGNDKLKSAMDRLEAACQDVLLNLETGADAEFESRIESALAELETHGAIPWEQMKAEFSK